MDADDHVMPRANGRHSPAEGDEYTEHDGVVVVPPRSRWERDRRAHERLSRAGRLVLPLLLLLTLDAAPWWDQPEQPATITAAEPAGELSTGKSSSCEASRFTVVGPADRVGSFRDCSDARRVGDEVSVRWRSGTSSEVAVGVLSWVEVLAWGVLSALACAVLHVLSARSERRRLERLASPTFRTRRR